jgi:hypothetical protein
MKPLSQSMINLTKSLLGRWTIVTAMGCILALACLVATSAQPPMSAKARPFKATGIPSFPAPGTFTIVGNATHLGNFVFPGTFEFAYASPDGSKVFYHIHGTYTAANGDTIEIDCPDWVGDYSVSPPLSWGLVNIIGGTGRFANASGSYVGTLSPGNAPTLFTAEGNISY